MGPLLSIIHEHYHLAHYLNETMNKCLRRDKYIPSTQHKKGMKDNEFGNFESKNYFYFSVSRNWSEKRVEESIIYTPGRNYKFVYLETISERVEFCSVCPVHGVCTGLPPPTYAQHFELPTHLKCLQIFSGDEKLRCVGSFEFVLENFGR